MERIHPSSVHPYVWADHAHRYKWASLFSRGKVLDFACGVGYGSVYVLESPEFENYIGADISLEAIKLARKDFHFPSVDFLVAHSDYLPFRDNYFDTVICFETLEHLEDPERLVVQFQKVMKKDGVLIGSVPSRQQEELIDKIYGTNPFHKTRFDFTRLSFLLKKYFKYIRFYQQSLEVGSLLIPIQNISTISYGQIVQDSSLPSPERGNLLFVASNNKIEFQKKILEQFSFCIATSLFQVDEAHNSQIQNLENKVSFLQKENSRLEAAQREWITELEQVKQENSRLEAALQFSKKEAAEAKKIEQHLRNQFDELVSKIKFQENEIHSLRNLLDEINRSRYWRLIKWLWGQPLYRKIRGVVIRPTKKESLPPGNEATQFEQTQPEQVFKTNGAETMEKAANLDIFQPLQQFSDPVTFSDQELIWLENIQKQTPDVICVLHPEWRGIHASAEQMFEFLLEIKDNLDPGTASHYADLIAETGCSKVVISGFPVSYRYLVLALKQRHPKIRIFIIYHGHYNQYREDYDRLSYSTMLNLAKAGKVDKLGFVKAGMAEVVSAGAGVKTAFLMNWVEQIPEKPSQPWDGGPHLGMWLLWSGNWQKPPFTMLASSLLIPGSVIHGADTDERMKEYIQLMNIRAEFAGRPLPRAELLEAMSKMHLNLYVTFHECAPMLPLESLSVGVPCLLGPVSHYFEDEPYLHQRLVVPYPDRAEVVAAYAQRAIDEREKIISAYKQYAPEYHQRCKILLQNFLEI